MVCWSEDWIRRVIKDFNRGGRDALFSQRVGGRPPTFTPELLRAMVDVAPSNPGDRCDTGPWTLDRLRLVIVMEGIVESISKERLREILHEEAISFHAVKIWKESKDPRFQEKVRRLRALTNRPHHTPVVVAVDEMGPIQPKPYGGHSWAREGLPDLVRATYRRFDGVRHFMGMYDYYHRTIRGYASRRTCGADWMRFLRYVRTWYPPNERIYLILDNLSTHTTPAALREARRLKITYVPIPTSDSRLNPIESQFRVLKHRALDGNACVIT